MLERYLTGASTYAHSIDHLFLLIAVVVGFWLIVAEGVLFLLIFKFRAKDGRPTQHITGEEHHLKRWISIPHFLVIVCDIVILVPALSCVWYNIKQAMPPADADGARDRPAVGLEFSGAGSRRSPGYGRRHSHCWRDCT